MNIFCENCGHDVMQHKNCSFEHGMKCGACFVETLIAEKDEAIEKLGKLYAEKCSELASADSPATESMEWEKDGVEAAMFSPGTRVFDVKQVKELLAAREKEAYQKGKENGYAESESNYHFEDAEKECIKQTIDECIKAVEEMNGIDIGDDFDLFAREIKKRLLALRSEKVAE